MTRLLVSLILCGGVAVLGSACATKEFVQKQVSATESKLTQQVTSTESNLTQQVTAAQTKLSERADLQETKLRETADRAGESRQAIDAADQRLNTLDTRVGEAGALATGARARADLATASAHDAEARLSQRFAGRNKYRLLDAKSVYFASGQIELRSQDVNEVEEVAKALAADPNAILELQGFADAQGSDRYNRELARERVETVMRHLVQRHGIELRQLRALSMGKVAVAAGEKASPEALARARRVDMRLLTPWSSWEDAQTQVDRTTPEQRATVAPAPAAPATVAGVADQPEPSLLPEATRVDPPARRRLPEFLRDITPADLGGEYAEPAGPAGRSTRLPGDSAPAPPAR
jgi:outer membrane protein OmpA-like peptidoglycan-associated protein